jgi:hypothetical protein
LTFTDKNDKIVLSFHKIFGNILHGKCTENKEKDEVSWNLGKKVILMMFCKTSVYSTSTVSYKSKFENLYSVKK